MGNRHSKEITPWKNLVSRATILLMKVIQRDWYIFTPTLLQCTVCDILLIHQICRSINKVLLTMGLRLWFPLNVLLFICSLSFDHSFKIINKCLLHGRLSETNMQKMFLKLWGWSKFPRMHGKHANTCSRLTILDFFGGQQKANPGHAHAL